MPNEFIFAIAEALVLASLGNLVGEFILLFDLVVGHHWFGLINSRDSFSLGLHEKSRFRFFKYSRNWLSAFNTALINEVLLRSRSLCHSTLQASHYQKPKHTRQCNIYTFHNHPVEKEVYTTI